MLKKFACVSRDGLTLLAIASFSEYFLFLMYSEKGIVSVMLSSWEESSFRIEFAKVK